MVYLIQVKREELTTVDLFVESLDFDTINIKTASGETVTFNLKQELTINEFDMNSEFALQPSKYVYWSSLLETVRSYLESAQLTEEVKRADLYEPARLALVASGVTKPTKDQIDAKILQTPEYITTKETVARYSLYVKKLQYIVKAFEQRKDMIQQMGAEKRRQLDYENAIRAL